MPTIAHATAVTPRPSRKRPGSDRESRHDPLHHLDEALESSLGADLRLIYGMAVPILLVIAAMIPLFVSPSYWFVGAILLLELCLLGFVITKLLAMLGEPDPEDE